MGALTFAFTDIEGSTGRWERDRAAMQEAVQRHDTILRAAIERHGGRIFKTMGDAFCAAFIEPRDAIAAIVDSQQALVAEDFSAVGGLPVRAAIHTGSAEERDGDFFGPAVNKVSRLLAIGHGSQILLSRETAALVDEATVRELGAYHLKDFAEPQRVYQVVAPGLPADFPPLRSLGTLPSDTSIIDTQEFHPVPSFTGRRDELAAIEAALTYDGATVVVYGLGGIGKSSIAREYGWRTRDTYSVVWWLNAASEDGIIEGLLRLGAMFVKGLEQLADRRAAAQRVVNSVLGGFDKPLLLVFDNLEDEALMRTWLPGSGTRALATSRNAAWGADVTRIALDAWPTETAVAYLQRESERADLAESDARAIAETLGGLPLALTHAAAALRHMRMVAAQRYLDRIAEHLKKAPRGVEYPRSVFASFSTAIAQAQQQAPGASALLRFAASFAPDGIPDELFRQPVATYAIRDLRPIFENDLRLDEALGALDRLSLLAFSASTRTYRMHRLVQLAARDLAEDARQTWRECAVAVADAAFPEVELETWPQCERLMPHARAALEALPADSAPASAALLAHRAGVYAYQRGEFGTAEALHARALAISEKVLGPDDLTVAEILTRFAATYNDEARYDDAKPLLERALRIREKALGPDHPDVALSLNALAIPFARQGRFEVAEPLFTRALSISEKARGPNDAGVARSLNGLANVRKEQGRYDESQALHTRALEIWEKTLGPNHPTVANALNNLANMYAERGRFEEAFAMHLRALAIRENALGPEHFEVSHSLNNLAVAYFGQGRYEEVEPLFRRALAIREKSVGPHHPTVAESLNNLADLYRIQGRYGMAEPLNLRALTIWENEFGSDHPDVAKSLENLGNLYRDQRRYEEADSAQQRALSIREKAHGPDHPKVAISLEELANSYEAQGRSEEAEPLFMRALAIYEKVLEPKHPKLAKLREKLASLQT